MSKPIAKRIRWMSGLAAIVIALGVISTDAFARQHSNEGTVSSVERIGNHDSHYGAGTVAGAIAGGLLGNTVGHGDGRKAATVAGAVAGGAVGHQVEKNHRGDDHYRIRVRMDDGRMLRFNQDHSYGLRNGDRVWIEGGHVEPMRNRGR